MFFLKISSFTCPIAHWTMKKLLQTNIIKTKQFWWMKRNLNFIKIKKVEVRVPKITPACYFYARLKILLQNSLHVSLMRPRKKITKIISQCLCPAHYYKKKLPKTAGKSTESLCNIHTVFYYSRKKPNYRADNFICNSYLYIILIPIV